MRKYFGKNLSNTELEELRKRPAIDLEQVMPVVKNILDEIKTGGDDAVKNYTSKFDGVDLEDFLVTEEEMEIAAGNVSDDFKKAVKIAAENIEKFHKAQRSSTYEIETMPGVKCFQESRAIEKVGLYIPGGSAPLPSTLMMLAIPAKIAEVREIIVITPPDKNGRVADEILYVGKFLGVKNIFKVGGAQAVAAMAYGTKTIPKVDKICGPGNQYVTAAKMLVANDGVAIDFPAGPTEVLIIADGNARADFVAADLLSQAEHGEDSQVVLVSNSEDKIDAVLSESALQLELLPRKEIAAKALKDSFALIVENIEKAIEFSNLYAPEHLILNIEDARKYIPLVQSAGSVFLGQWSCEAAGDYASGPNHSLPTYGYARSYGGVCVDTFMKKITFQELDKEGVKNIGWTVETLAACEGLDGHKKAMSIRLNNLK